METLNISTVEQFLKDYSPKIKFYTSVEEIEEKRVRKNKYK